MDFSLSDDQLLLRDTIARLAADRFPPASRAAHVMPDAGHDPANWATLAGLGVLALPLAEADGGLGGSLADLAVVAEAFGAGLVAEPLLSEWAAAGLLARAGSDAQKARWLPRWIEGGAHLALAWAEPATRFVLDRPATRAISDGDAYRLAGAKTFVAAGAASDAFIVTARDPAGAPRLWLIERAAPGLAARPYRLLDNSTVLELHLDDVPAAPLPGDIAHLAAIVDEQRVLACAEMLGIMRLLFATTLDHVRQRRQFGVPIGSFQAIQHRLVDLYVAIEQSWSLVCRALAATPAALPAAAAAAKAYVSEAAVKLGEECIQFHGGMGITDELIVGHGHKRILLLAAQFGDPDAERARYAALAA